MNAAGANMQILKIQTQQKKIIKAKTKKIMKTNPKFYSLICGLIFISELFSQNLVTFLPPEKPNAPPERDTIQLKTEQGLDCFQVFENKIKVEEWCIKNGKRNGTWTIYYPNGVLLSTAEFIDGKKNGLYIECEKSGAVLVQEYFKNDVLDGEQRKYVTVKNVRILKTVNNYKNGVLNGMCTEYTDMGYVQSQTEYAMGIKNGISRWYFSNGRLAMEQTYQNNMLNGAQQVYNQAGVLLTSGNFKNNLKEGAWTEYHENGKIKSSGNYKNDAPCGDWKYYDLNGNLASTEKAAGC